MLSICLIVTCLLHKLVNCCQYLLSGLTLMSLLRLGTMVKPVPLPLTSAATGAAGGSVAGGVPGALVGGALGVASSLLGVFLEIIIPIR